MKVCPCPSYGAGRLLRIAVCFFTDKGDPMFNLTDLLDQLGAHFSLVVIACIELLAAALLVACAVRSEDNRPVGGRRSAVGKAGENGAEMLRALNFHRFEANLLLRRATSLCTREAFAARHPQIQPRNSFASFSPRKSSPPTSPFVHCISRRAMVK